MSPLLCDLFFFGVNLTASSEQNNNSYRGKQTASEFAFLRSSTAAFHATVYLTRVSESDMLVDGID
jgi:hypothetical protein